MWCRAVWYMDTQEASSSILRLEDGGSMSRRNAGGASCPSYTEAHPVILTLTPRLVSFITLSPYVSQQNVQTNTVFGRKPCLDFWTGVCHQHDINIQVIFGVWCMISPKPWYSYIFCLSYTWYIRVTSSMKCEFILDPESWRTVVNLACSITCARDRCVSLF